MAPSKSTSVSPRTPIGLREPTRGLRDTFRGVTRENAPGQVLAGVTLLAIAVPEQLATSQLAGVPAFIAMIAFITATLVFVVFGSNPIMSIGADSTIAPLFAVVLLRLAPLSTTLYFELVAMTAVVTGLALLGVGLLRLGWIADFLSLPIVNGFLGGIGVIIIVHQLPSALGISSGGTSVLQRLDSVAHLLGHVSGWSVALALGTLVALVVGEKISARMPWALGAIAIATALTVVMSLSRHGVRELGAVTVGLPTWRLHWLSASQWGVVLTTAVTLVIVILSQTSATTRTSSDDLGVASDISRDFVGVGLANVAAGLAGAFPVDASPARTTVACLAGGRTKLVGLTAAILAIAFSPLGRYAHTIPLAALAGVLFFIAARLIKINQLVKIYRVSRLEFLFALISALGVVLVGVEQGLAIAVGLAVLDQTWRSARPHMIEMGRRSGTTSWEPLGQTGVALVDHVLTVLFDNELFFANAGIFRRELHQLMAKHPETKHVVVDAVAISDIDFTGLTMLGQVVDDLKRDGVTISLARVSDKLKESLAISFDQDLRGIKISDNVNDAVVAVADSAS
ncbi:MAG TPA: SulP family inorganic anion transporter [Acidimicrobiales bacterium]|nr:SulP family inorganic anion transporter [Acidimicrobiales bacterium]